MWPSQSEVCETSETVVETVKPKFENQLLAKEEEKNLIVDQLLHKYSSYWKLLRVTAHVKRFGNNCKKTEKQKGPLKTEELQVAERFWITHAQAVRVPKSDVNLEKDEDGILRCVSRVPGYYPIFLPQECELTSLVALKVHKQMLHGGVSVTMCRMREQFWVPKLRSWTKKVIQNCNVCKRYREKPISASHYPPEYLRDLFRLRDNIKNLRGVNKLQVPKPNTTRYGKNSVKYLAAITWNKISDTLRSLSTLSAYKKAVRQLRF